MAKNTKYGAKAVKVMEWLNTEPSASDAHIAKHVGCHPTYVKQLRRKMIHVQQEEKFTEELLLDTLHKVSQGKGKPKPGEYIEVEGQLSPNEIDEILTERGNRYGPFLSHAMITQMLKNTTNTYLTQHNKLLMPDQQEALDMIFHKIGRILNGDPDYVDSWVDIAGYAKLVADRLEGNVR